MAKELVHVGFDNFISINRIVAIASTKSSSIKRAMQEAKDTGLLIDVTHGRKTKAVIITDSRHVFVAALAPEVIAGRLQASRANGGYPDLESSLVIPEPDNEKGD